jgi:hypothetical protein
MPNFYALAMPIAQAAARFAPTVKKVPVALALAIAQQESSFDPNARPYTNDPKSALKKKGVPLKFNGRMVRSTALGYYQVVDGSLKEFGLTPEQRVDPVAATRGAINVFSKYGSIVDAAFPGLPPDVRAGAAYAGHWRGQGSLRSALAKMKAQKLPLTLQNIANVLGVPVGPMQNVQRYYTYWAKAAADLGNNWEGLLAWGAQQGGPTYVGRKRRGAVPAGLGGGAGGGGGGGAIFIGIGVAALLLLKKK